MMPPPHIEKGRVKPIYKLLSCSQEPYTVTHLACVLKSNTRYWLWGDPISSNLSVNKLSLLMKLTLLSIRNPLDTLRTHRKPQNKHQFTHSFTHILLYYFCITFQIRESNTRLQRVHTSTTAYTACSCACTRRTWPPSNTLQVRDPPGARLVRPKHA